MKIRNNLNSGISTTLKNGTSFVFPASTTVEVDKNLITERIDNLVKIGYLTLIEDTTATVKEDEQVNTEATETVKKVKGGKK